MNEKRFITIDHSTCVFDKITKEEYVCIDREEAFLVCKRLNEQQATIDEQKIIIEERDVANERLNRFLNEIGLEKEYIKWEFKKGVLNELNEENDVLKQQLKTKYVVNKQYEELQRLKKDNKELKKENKRLAKNLKVAKNNVDANFKSAQYWRQKFEAIPENIRMVWTE